MDLAKGEPVGLIGTRSVAVVQRPAGSTNNEIVRRYDGNEM